MAGNHRPDAQAFIAHMKNGGFRPNRYRVTLQAANLKEIDSDLKDALQESLSFLCVAAQVPQSTMGIAEAHYFGRPVKMAGDKTFEDWTVEVYTDSDYKVRNALELWHDRILGFETNLASSTYQQPLVYYADAKVELLSREDEIITAYKMKQIFPSNIGEIALSYENNNQIARFPVTFAVNYFAREHDGVEFKKIKDGGWW